MQQNEEVLKEIVKEKYASVARNTQSQESTCCGGSSCCGASLFKLKNRPEMRTYTLKSFSENPY